MTAGDAHHSALQYAYRLLSYRGRSEAEMIVKLRMKGFDDPTIRKAVEDLRSSGFLNDRRLASSLRRYAEETKHLGIAGTRRFLRERGVPADIADETVRDMDEAEAARRLVEKKLRLMGNYPPLKVLRRLYAALYRRGYSPGIIRKVLERVQPDNKFNPG